MAETVTEREIEASFGAVVRAFDSKTIKKMMRSANRKEGNRLKKKAVSQIGSTGLLSAKGLKHRRDSTTSAQVFGKSYHVRVFPNKYGSGFMVSAAPHGDKYMHVTRSGKKKPVAFWAEEGTFSRRVGKRTSGENYRTGTGRKARRYERSGHSTGRMPAYKILQRVENAEAGSVESSLWETFQKKVEQQARKENLL